MRKSYSSIDTTLLFLVLGLLAFGVIMIASIGVPKSIQLSAPGIMYPDCGSAEVQCYLVLKNHVIRVILGVLGMFLVMKIPYRFWQKVSLPIFAGSIFLLIAVFLFGDDNNTFAQSWINLPGIPFLNSVQPSEIAKFGMVIYFASWLQGKRMEIETWEGGFLPFCLVSGAFVLPVMLQPDFGSTLVLIMIAVGIYFVAGANLKHLATGALIALVAGIFIVNSASYLQQRFTAFISPDTECREDFCWQTEQAKIAIGSGGFFGKGLTQGIQKSYWLPQATDDFIFAASAEELGFVRTLLVVMAYAWIAIRGYQIANHAPDRFSQLLAVGVTTWIAAQVFMNLAVNTSLMPVTGITLPFVSYGGSSMFTTLIGIGILLNISKYTQNHAYTLDRGRDRRTRRPSRYNYRRA
ncbi:MAG: putative peptidoglycan glycosyltransferase FtsW [Candidatus Peregrinibacteria bacterium]|nr:putative peptidoglycan glycosyltransferase FtsW [Candidatus Peregrinibacteria bacterium]MDZ4244313.1 putative peptidoglycan glycosyltransferase FtsW [Candidatus Gracilibacteria bacterium]